MWRHTRKLPDIKGNTFSFSTLSVPPGHSESNLKAAVIFVPNFSKLCTVITVCIFGIKCRSTYKLNYKTVLSKISPGNTQHPVLLSRIARIQQSIYWPPERQVFLGKVSSLEQFNSYVISCILFDGKYVNFKITCRNRKIKAWFILNKKRLFLFPGFSFQSSFLLLRSFWI